ncbi:hypothetical protein BST63_20595 [Bradyrhizobium canariense]|uniref:Uncharacterized protein n=1 Tax=Bradyrhizobium canariense TaxID=255045 RepID=A0ABX3X1Y4_9BRAD|nr:hypothetical protein BSR47_00515 [Bradyrhizobium canariense]OSJ26671.1 hypothetical protein BST63_20595 [Bradyrhizobium canariense]
MRWAYVGVVIYWPDDLRLSDIEPRFRDAATGVLRSGLAGSSHSHVFTAESLRYLKGWLQAQNTGNIEWPPA